VVVIIAEEPIIGEFIDDKFIGTECIWIGLKSMECADDEDKEEDEEDADNEDEVLKKEKDWIGEEGRDFIRFVLWLIKRESAKVSE